MNEGNMLLRATEAAEELIKVCSSSLVYLGYSFEFEK